MNTTYDEMTERLAKMLYHLIDWEKYEIEYKGYLSEYAKEFRKELEALIKLTEEKSDVL